MKRKMFLGLCMATFIAPVAMAQYPQLTEEAKQAYQKMMSEERRRSDEAWAKALPVVQKEAREGRPYISWASRPYDLPQARIPAFPGAEGGGMYSFGGRGGKVITVTNLNDRGPGSFREACETGGARIIVFNVSGIIKLESPIIVRAPYVTIAGQTAPGDGVCIAGESFWVNTHDVVVRHMRFRRGETKVWHRDDSFGGNPIGNIMIDHCSCTWGLDENISFYRHMYDPSEGQYESKDLKLPTVNVTIQNTISAKALDTYNHAFGSTLGGENCAFMRNLWASNSGRNPSVGWNGVFNFVNNVVFNWVHRSSDGGDYTAMFNMINNYYKPGPATPKDTPVGHRILKPEAGRSKLDHKVYGRVYADGNIMEGYPAITEDNWAGGIQIETQPNTDGYTENMRSNRPFEMPYIRITSAHDAYDFVLKNAGANIPCRDIVDERIVEEVRTGVPYYDKKMAKDANGDLSMLDAIAPADIETFTILKDASETAQYGSRGAAGVIVVTTVKGKNGMKTLSYNGNFGISNVYKNLKMLSADEFRSTAKALGMTPLDMGGNTNFFDEIEQLGYTQNHNISFGAGNDDSNYRASVGVIDQQGIIKNSGMKNYTAKLDASQNMFNNKLKIEFGMFGSLKQVDYTNDYEKTFYSAATYNPTFPTHKNEDGKWDEDPYANEIQNPLGRLEIQDREKSATD